MNPFTQTLWNVITDCPDFLAQLSTIMKREYKPFSFGTSEKAFQANVKMLEGYVREELDKWYEWLPDTPINRIGGSLVVEMLDCVDWDQVAQWHILHTNLAALAVSHPKPATAI
ncbi:MAG: hypothetical protein ACRDIV_14845 [Ktedonobacteraceae bacterium]